MRGPIPGIPTLLAPIFYAFTQAREDLAAHTSDLSTDQIWQSPHDIGSVGFHIAHIAGSTDRLTTYLEQRDLSPAQFAALEAEKDPGASRDVLLENMHRAFERTESVVRQLDLSTLAEPRYVGRRKLPTTVIGLLSHIAEHTQRHTGAAIVIAKLVRAR